MSKTQSLLSEGWKRIRSDEVNPKETKLVRFTPGSKSRKLLRILPFDLDREYYTADPGSGKTYPPVIKKPHHRIFVWLSDLSK